MVKWFQVIFISILVLGLSCESTNKVEVLEVDEIELKPVDKLEFLNNHNSDKYLYKGTEKYEEILNSGNLITYDTTLDVDYIWEIQNNSKFDSIFYKLEKDTLYISHDFFILSRVGNEEFPYLEYKENRAYLKTPLLGLGYVKIEGADTVVGSSIGCDAAGPVGHRFKIPLSKLENADHLYFKGEEIIFK